MDAEVPELVESSNDQSSSAQKMSQERGPSIYQWAWQFSFFPLEL